MDRLQRALASISLFERGMFQAPAEAERLLTEVFEACGHSVVEKGFIESDRRMVVDCFFRMKVGEKLETIAVEIKAGSHQVDSGSIDQAFALQSSGHFDRAMVVSRASFSAAAYQHATAIGLGKIDLFSPQDLRVWVGRQIQPPDINQACERIMRSAMRQLARLVAEKPETLADLEWRDLEKVLREAFEGIGFDTKLTRSGKDGGYDLELTILENDRKSIYLVEVKHWSEQKPGSSHLTKFVGVTAARKAAGGLMLSTSGFAGTINSGIAEISAPIHLGTGDKVVALCKIYYRLQTALWTEDIDLRETLFSGTSMVKPGSPGRSSAPN